MTSLTRQLAEQLIQEQGSNVIIPDIYTSIEPYAFESSQLLSVEIPENIIEIGESAFSDNLLTSVIIPDSTIAIGGPGIRFE